jgi:hypothetical protein
MKVREIAIGGLCYRFHGGNTDCQDRWQTHLDCIYTVHKNNIWLTQQNAGQTQHQKCRPTT